MPGSIGHYEHSYQWLNAWEPVVSWILGIVTGVTLFGLALTALSPKPMSLWWTPVFVLAFFTPVVLSFVVWHNLLSRFLPDWKLRDRREVESHAYRVCLHCRYDLTAAGNSGLCPECGESFDLATLERSWRWTYSQGDRARPREWVIDGVDRYPEFY